MTHREAAAIAFKECGLSQADFDAAAVITDARTMGTDWTAASHGQIPAGQERAQIDEIKLVLNGGQSETIPSGEYIVAELERIRGSN